MLGDERANLRNRRRALENVDLVDDHDDLLAPRPNLFHEAPLGFGERAIGGRDEKDQIGPRDEVRRHHLVLADDGVGSRRIDDADFLEQIAPAP